MDDKTYEGFVAGVVYATALLAEYKLDAQAILTESNIPNSDLLKFGEVCDLVTLGLIDE